VALFILATSAAIVAQGGKVIIRLIPRPNQTAHFEITQEMDLEVVYERNLEASGKTTSDPMKMTGKSTWVFTQKNGEMNEQGNMEAQITYDRLSMERSMNGKTLTADNLADSLIGKTITLTFDKEGNVVDVKVPPEVNIPADMFRQIMDSMYNNLPKTPLAIGETVAVPFSMPLPIPTPGAGPLNLEGQSKYKLVAIASDGKDSLPRFEQTVEAALVKTIEVDTPSGKSKVNVNVQLTGGGVLELNLNKGILKTGDMQTTVDGKISMVTDVQKAKLQTIKLHGTMKMVSSSHN
jgi:hypothetical protein